MRISDCSSDVCSSDLHGWLVLLRRRAARRDQALWPGWPAARLLAARSRADPAGIDLCRLAAPERVRQPLLRTGADRAPHPRGEAAVILPALLAALITAFPAAAPPPSPTRQPKQGYWLYQAPPPVEDAEDRKSTRLNSSHSCAPRMP